MCYSEADHYSDLIEEKKLDTLIMEQPKMQRLLRLLMLLSGRRKYTLAELAERFEFSERSVYRYLDTIEDAGFLIERNGGTYRLVENVTSGRALERLFHFSEEEAWLLYQTLEHLEGASPVKERLVCKLHTLYDFKALSRLGVSNAHEIVGKISAAISRRKQVRLSDYRSSHSNRIADRKVEPFDFLPDYMGVWCYDLESGTCKQFKISRIKDVEILPDAWTFEARHVVPFVDAFRMAAPGPVSQVKAFLSLQAYNLLIEEYPLAGKYIYQEGDCYKLDIPVADFNGVGRFVLGLPEDVEIMEPDEFKAFLREKIRKNFLMTEVVSYR